MCVRVHARTVAEPLPRGQICMVKFSSLICCVKHVCTVSRDLDAFSVCRFVREPFEIHSVTASHNEIAKTLQWTDILKEGRGLSNDNKTSPLT